MGILPTSIIEKRFIHPAEAIRGTAFGLTEFSSGRIFSFDAGALSSRVQEKPYENCIRSLAWLERV